MKSLFLIISIFSSVVVYSQTNFVPGYVVTIEGDSLKGLVSEQSADLTELGFKQSDNATARKYTLAEITGYGIEDGKTFVVKQLPVDSAHTEIHLAEILVRGKASLYRYNNIFFIEKGTSIHILELGKKNVVRQGLQYEQKQKRYIGILNYLFLDCPGMSKSVMNITLQEKDLTKIAIKYNRCMNADYTEFKSKLPRFKLGYSVYGGIDLSSISFTTAYFMEIEEPKVKMSAAAPTVGVGFVLSNPREHDRIFATLDFLFSHVSYNGSSQSADPYRKYEESYTLTYNRIKIPLGIKYIFRSGRTLSYYGRVGYCLNFWTGGNFNELQTKTYPPSQPRDYRFDKGMEKIILGQFWTTAGIQMSKTKVKGFVEIRVEALGGDSNRAVMTADGITVMDPKSFGVQTYSMYIGILL